MAGITLVVLVLAGFVACSPFDVKTRPSLQAPLHMADINSDLFSSAPPFSKAKLADKLNFGNPLQNWGYINVADEPFNACGNGTLDDTEPIQAALNYALSLGGAIVFLPAGNYLVEGNLVIYNNTVLKGIASTVPRIYGTPGYVRGTTLWATNGQGESSGTPFIYLVGYAATVEGLSIYYPEQVAQNPPTPYPFCIQGNGENLSIKNVLLVNPYQGVDFATYSCPRHYIEGLYGQTLLTGVAVDQCYDIGRIKHVHIWPFWSMNQDLFNWIGQNGYTFRFYRSDWEVVEDVFSWGYHCGMSFEASQYGSLNGQFTDVNFDNVDIGLWVQSTQQYGIMFSNLNLANAGLGSVRVGILSPAGDIAVMALRGASFWGQFYNNIVWDNTGELTVSNSMFMGWGHLNSSIELIQGRSILTELFFSDKIGNSIYIGEGTDRVIVSNCDLVGNPLVNNNAQGNVLVANNLA